MHRSHPSWRTPVAALAAAIGLVACTVNGTSLTEERTSAIDESSAVALDAAHRGHGSPTHRELSASDLQAIAQVRRATAQYHDIRKAQADGYDTQYPAGCAASPDGGQGFHWLNEDLVDGTVELLRPELVMYEPQPGGSMRLVGVDYVVPYVEGSTAPTLLGREFAHNVPLNVWALHIWAWAPNENGMFAAWNPGVSCEFAG
ncbi:MAG TPA: hypothetical protein VFZ13_03010 [Gemmatimonadales bacterium]